MKWLLFSSGRLLEVINDYQEDCRQNSLPTNTVRYRSIGSFCFVWTDRPETTALLEQILSQKKIRFYSLPRGQWWL